MSEVVEPSTADSSTDPEPRPAGPRAPVSVRDRVVASLALVIVASVGAIYAQVRSHGFAIPDDLGRLLRSPAFQEGGWHGVVHAFTTWFQGAWTPLTLLSLQLGQALHGDAAGSHALTNAVLHTLAALLLLVALVRMTGARWCAGFAALFFAVHPLHVESVAWVAARADVLSGVFFMGTLLAYAHHAQRPSARRMLAVTALLAAGLLASPTLVMVPLLLLLLDYWPLRRSGLETSGPPDAARLRALVIEKWPLFAAVALVLIVSALGPGAAGAPPAEPLPLGARIANALVAVVTYLSQTLLPQGLAVVYPVATQPDWQSAGAAALLIAGSSVFAVRFGREQPYLLVGWLWFLGMLVPALAGVQTGASAHADRAMYLPQIGLTLAFAWGAADVVTRSPALRPAFVVVGTLVIGWFGGLAWQQTALWRDRIALYQHAAAVTEDNAVAHAALAEALLERGHPVEALAQFEQARQLRPGWSVAELGGADALVQLGRPAAAETIYERWIAAVPDAPRPVASRGLARLQQGRIEEARADFERALSLDPDLAEAHTGLGVTYDAMGHTREAMGAYREALRLDPTLPTPTNNLAWALATASDPTLRDPGEAVRLAERAVAQKPEDPAARDTLAVAYAAAGRFEEAARVGEEALDLAEQRGAEAFAAELRERLARYRAGRAYP